MENLANHLVVDSSNSLDLFERTMGLFNIAVRKGEKSEAQINEERFEQSLRFESQACLGESFASLKL